ncbi:hypothetical protein Tsubulata_011387 [Turnera subulata]|uniref:Protein CMSS1 n=1 Tax=Turnera subulata TaxID=218843 RepID=A0A9Q0GF69_9ROSI|nr:hypothetical protein Tsubulata_011387 [Turnera subulata]
MGSGKAERSEKAKSKGNKNTPLLTNPKPTKFKNKKKHHPPPRLGGSKKKPIPQTKNNQPNNNNNNEAEAVVPPATTSQQLRFFIDEFQSANGVQLSTLELESIKDSSFVELSPQLGGQDVEHLGKHMKAVFGSSWKQALSQGQLVEGNIDPGSPAVLIISTSALRCIELLRGVRSLTKECHAVKLFSKHMKVEEQVALLKNRVNFASGTPNRLKKLIDIEALGLSRLTMILLDMHTDVKGYSLLTLPQVRDEFWDLYKSYFHQRLLQGDLRICLFGPIPNDNELRGKKRRASDE